MERFVDRDLSGAEFRECVLNDVRFIGVEMRGARIEGEVIDLTVNGVEVMPFVEAELDRRHPERVLLRSDDLDELREGWRILQADWAATIERIRRTPGIERRSVNGEYSPLETLRHLLFASDVWFRRGVLGEETPYPAIGLPGAWLAPGELPEVDARVDRDADPSLDEVLAARAERVDALTAYLGDADPATLAAPRPTLTTKGWPPNQPEYTVLDALRVVPEEEWWHLRFTVRDLDLIEKEDSS